MKVSGQLHIPTNLLPEEEPLVPVVKRLDGSQSRTECYGENSCLYQELNPDISIL
jgi:hypothetical protein